MAYEILIAEAFLLFVYRLMCSNDRKDAYFLLFFLLVGLTLALYEGVNPWIILLGIILFNGLASTYHTKENYIFVVLALFFMFQMYMVVQLIAQSMLLGFLSAAYFFTKHTERARMDVERKRDIVQLFFGLAFIYAFVVFPASTVGLFIVVAILAGSTLGNFSINNKRSIVSRMLHSFERNDAVLGQGAMWLAVGTLLAIGFLSGNRLVAVLVPLFVGDAVATIAGTSYMMPLPYNKKKSAVGTLAYFASSAIISFPFVGYLGVATALVAAIVESLPKHLDDNFDTAVVLTVLLKLLSYMRLI